MGGRTRATETPAPRGHWKQRDRDEAVREHWADQGLSLRGVARRVGMSPPGVARVAKRLGLPGRSPPYYKQDEELKRLAREPGFQSMSLREVARRVGMSPTGARKAMARLGLYQPNEEEEG